MVHILVTKCGNIATSTMVDLLLDETASRKGLRITTLGSGPKMTPQETKRIANLMSTIDHELVVLCGPNVAAPGMVKIRKILQSGIIPWMVISDGPSRRAMKKLKKEGAGYLIMEGDPLIGARREFLDPTEMAVFNSDVIKILSVAGSFRAVQSELDKVISSLDGDEIYLPHKVISSSVSLSHAGFSNPYARAKAAAAFRLAQDAAEINYKACFVESKREKYIRLAACAHEAVRAGASLADEARELEKQRDSLLRTPHTNKGKTMRKTSLYQKPTED